MPLNFFWESKDGESIIELSSKKYQVCNRTCEISKEVYQIDGLVGKFLDFPFHNPHYFESAQEDMGESKWKTPWDMQ